MRDNKHKKNLNHTSHSRFLDDNKRVNRVMYHKLFRVMDLFRGEKIIGTKLIQIKHKTYST